MRNLAMVMVAGLASGVMAQDAPLAELSEAEAEAMVEAHWAARNPAEAAVYARRDRILEELEALDREALPEDHWAREWAGEYYVGDGTGMNVTIVVAPESGAAYTWRGCLGLYDSNHGEIVEVLDDGLLLQLAVDPDEKTRPFMDERLYFVRWGERRYLVPERQMMDLVNNFNEGGYARSGLYSAPRLDSGIMFNGDAPAGVPELPERWAKLLLTKLVKLEVTAVGERSPALMPSGFQKWEVEFAGGSADGAYVGLTVTNARGMMHGTVEITHVDEHGCRGWLNFYMGEGTPPELGVGEQFVAPIGL